MAMIRSNDGTGKKFNDFEFSAVHLLSHDPVANSVSSEECSSTQDTIAEPNAEASSKSSSGKAPIGKTGVRLR